MFGRKREIDKVMEKLFAKYLTCERFQSKNVLACYDALEVNMGTCEGCPKLEHKIEMARRVYHGIRIKKKNYH